MRENLIFYIVIFLFTLFDLCFHAHYHRRRELWKTFNRVPALSVPPPAVSFTPGIVPFAKGRAEALPKGGGLYKIGSRTIRWEVRHMKKTVRWLFPLLWLLLCAAVLGFLHRFTVVDKTMEFLNWESAVQVLEDGAYTMFPPLIRFLPEGMENQEAYAYANLGGIPAGAAAVILLSAAALFLLGLSQGKPDVSLLFLMLAAASLAGYPLIQRYGVYFLSQEAVAFWGGEAFLWAAPLSLLVYLLFNRSREFRRRLGWAALWSAVALGIGYLISLARDGYLARYLSLQISSLFRLGRYQGILTWLTYWLAGAAILLSAYQVMTSFARQRAENQALKLREQQTQLHYQGIQQRLREDAALRHEHRHRMAALEALCRQKEYGQLEALLEKWSGLEAGQAPPRFTGNVTVNVIVQDAAARAQSLGFALKAQIRLPETLSIPGEDLCTLFMNLLDNALEACARVEPASRRFLRLKAEVRHGFLAVKCENSYQGELRRDENGKFVTTKDDPESHGFGLRQMEALAQRYHSVLDVSCTEDTFTVQTALQLPKEA